MSSNKKKLKPTILVHLDEADLQPVEKYSKKVVEFCGADYNVDISKIHHESKLVSNVIKLNLKFLSFNF